MTGELDYGNARIHARRPAIISGERLESMLDLSLDDLVSTLAHGTLRRELQQAVLRFEGSRRIHEALRIHLASTLRVTLRFYDGNVRSQLELLLSRWDLQNLLTLLRGQARRATADELSPLMVPAGQLDAPALDQLAREPGLRPMIERMVVWGVPTPKVARRLLDAWPAYAQYDDVARLEHRLVQLHASHVAEILDTEQVDSVLARALRLEVDARQIVTALRLWEARERGDIESTAEASHRWGDLDGGTMDPDALRDAIEHGRREEVGAAIRASAPGHLFMVQIAEWERDGALTALETRLHAAVVGWVLRAASQADPLSIAVPIGYAFAKEAEMRNLRLVAAVAAGHLSRPDATSQMIR